MEKLQITIGRRLRAARAMRNLTQDQLADFAHIPQEHISRLERGTWKTVNPEHLLKLAQALRISLDALFAADESEWQAALTDGLDSNRSMRRWRGTASPLPGPIVHARMY